MRPDGAETILNGAAFLSALMAAVGFISFLHAGNNTVSPQTITLESVECWFDTPDEPPVTSCFYMHVPQDYENRQGLWIYFPVVKFSALDSRSGKSPVIHLGGGGPGNPMGFLPQWDVSWILNFYQGMSVERGRDLYVIDPRGIGHVAPVLTCPEYVDAVEGVLGKIVSIEEENQIVMQAYRDCRDRLAGQGVEFSFYNSVTVSKDVEWLRRRLGVDKWNLYGVSYSSRYARTIAGDYPQTVDSMVLDAAAVSDIAYTEHLGDVYLQTLERLFTYCENETGCKETLGDVGASFWRMIEKLDADPVSVEVGHPEGLEKLNVRLNGIRLMNVYFYALYDAQGYSDFAKIVNGLAGGESKQVKKHVQNWVYFLLDRNYGHASAIAHYCFEEAPFVDFDKAARNLEILPRMVKQAVSIELERAKGLCEGWKIIAPNETEDGAVTTDVPTLFLHGVLDPVLPVEDLDKQMETFTNTDKVTFDDTSHTVVGAHPCGSEIAGEFFDHKLKFRDEIGCDL